jgi:ABC-type Na+ efflux pump permease subunit
MNRNIIIAIIIIVIIAIVGAFVLTNQGSNEKIDVKINYLNDNATFKNGDEFQFELKDAQGNAVTGQIVNITYNNEKYSVVTDNSGKAFLTIAGEEPGKYDVTVDYNGTAKYNGCTAKTTVTVEEGTSTAAANSTANSTASTAAYNNATSTGSGQQQATSSQSYYDADLNVYYDSNGKIIGGQNDGSSIYEVRNNQPQIDEQGNLE